MNREEIKVRVINEIKSYLGSNEPIDENSSLNQDLGVDSSRFVDLAFSIESAFDVEIEAQTLFSLVVVGDIVNAIEQALSVKQ